MGGPNRNGEGHPVADYVLYRKGYLFEICEISLFAWRAVLMGI